MVRFIVGTMLVALACGCSFVEKEVADDSTVSAACPGGRSDAVAFSVVNLGRAAENNIPYIEGPEARAVVRSPAEWDSTWHRLAKGYATPEAHLADSTLLIAATRVFGSGPAEFRIERVRRCRANHELVAFTRLYVHEVLHDYGTRSLTAVSISRREADGAVIRFVALPNAHKR